MTRMTTVPPVSWAPDGMPALDPTVLVISSPHALAAARSAGLPLGQSTVVSTDDAPMVDTSHATQVVALGAGTVIDAAKLVAFRGELPLTVVPSVLSTDAAFSTVAALRREGTVTYVDTGAADRVVLSDALLRQAPWRGHLCGLGDLLAVDVATRDWEVLDPGTGSAIRAAARALVTTALDQVWRWRAYSRDCLALLSDLLRTKVAVGLAAGTPWAEEGTEHYLAYRLEGSLNRRVWHGELLLACLPVCAVLQHWEPEQTERLAGFVTEVFGGPVAGGDLAHVSAVLPALVDLPDYCRQHGLDNTVVLGRRPGSSELDAAAAAWAHGW